MTMLRLSVVLHNGLERHVTVMKLNKSVRDLSTSGCPMSDEAKAKPFHAIPGPGGLYQWPFIGSLLNFKPFSKFIYFCL